MAKFRQPPSSAAEATIVSKTITANGTYNASSDSADGYNPVIVSVPEKVIISKSITANGTYNASSDNADGYDPVTVNVPGSGILVGNTPPLDSLGENGNYYYQRDQYTYENENGTTRQSATGASGQTICGYKFRTDNEIIISGLRFYTNITDLPITVKLYDSNHQLLISGTMTPSITGWNTILCSDTTLESNMEYYIIAECSSVVFSYWALNLVTVNVPITIIGGAYGSSFNIDSNNIYSVDIVVKIPIEYTHEYVIGQYYKSNGHWEEIVPVT